MSGLRRLDDGVWAFLAPGGGWGKANTGLACGGAASAVIDTPWDTRRTAEFLAAIAPHVRTAPVTDAINTHADGDHWWGNAALPADTRITATEATAAAMRHESTPQEVGLLCAGAAVLSRLPGRPGATGAIMGQIFEGVHRPRRLRFPDHTFTGTTSLDVDGRTLALADLGPAHTSSDVAVHLPDAGVVFAGDLLFAGSTPILWHGPLGNQTAALDRLLELSADTYVPGHGPLVGRDGVREAGAYWDWFGRVAREQYDLGRPPLAAGRAMLRDAGFGRFAGWLHPERLGISLHTVYREFAGRPLRLPTRRDRSAAFGDAGLLQRELARRS